MNIFPFSFTDIILLHKYYRDKTVKEKGLACSQQMVIAITTA